MDYRIRIVVNGEGDAPAFLGRVQGGLGGIAQIAAGGVLAGGIMAFGNALGSATQQAVSAVSNYERLGMSLEALLAREIRNATGIEKTIVVGQQRIQLTEQEIAQIGKLKDALQTESLQREVLGAKIQEQKERIRQLTEQYGENGLVVIKERAELALMEQAYAKSGTAIDKYGQQIATLEGKQGKLADVTKKVVEGQLSMNEALAQAGPKAQEMLQWVERLAILSPFKSEDIAASLQQAMNFQFSSQQAQRLTQDLVDLGAATGATGDKMRLISYAIGQINLSDKLLMQDLRQLINAGVDVESVLKKMGYSLKDVGEKSIDSKKFIEMFLQTVEQDFGGAAQRQAESLTGLLTSLDEIKDIALRDIFTGALMAAKPVLADIVGLVTNPGFRAGLQGFGTWVGEGVKSAVGLLKEGIGVVRNFKKEFDFQRMMGKSPLDALQSALRVTLPPEARGAIDGFFAALQTGMTFVNGTVIPAFQTFIALAGPQLGAGLQIVVKWIQQLASFALPLLVQGFQWASQNMGIVTPILLALAGVLALILGPVIAIPAALILLGTAWANNWGGIQEKTAAVAAFLGPILQQIADFFTTILIPALLNLGAQAGPVLTAIGAFFTGVILPALAGLAQWLMLNIPAAIGAFQTAWLNAQPTLQMIGRAVTAVIGIVTSLSAIWLNINRLVNQFAQYLSDVILQFLGVDRSAQATQQRLQGVGDFLGVIGGIIKTFIDAVLVELNKQFSALVGLLELLAKWLGIVADALSNLQVPDAFQRHSPSPFEQMLMNSNAHLREMATLMPNSLGKLGGYGAPNVSLLPATGGIGFGANARGGGQWQDARRTVNIHGPVYVQANDAHAFMGSLQELEEDVITRDRMGE
mgnify:CR=1 FL=1